MELLAKAFMQANPGSRVEVLPAVGSAGGISAVIEGKIELAVANREPNAAEQARRALQSREYARTAFVMAVHRDVGVTRVSAAELAAMYGEGAASFPNGKRARPVLRLADATDTNLIKSIGPAVSTALEAAHSRRGLLNANTDTETADLIERTPGAFGPSTLALIASEGRPLVALVIDGKEPTNASLASGAYPWSKPMHLIAASPAAPHVQSFVDFVMSPAGKRILDRHGHLSR
jgi:phosphate transport system substrate-binding protein